jgi:hypothetical protein
VGVEPTIHPAKGRIAGFEDREDHRTPFTSAHAGQNDNTRINPQPQTPLSAGLDCSVSVGLPESCFTLGARGTRAFFKPAFCRMCRRFYFTVTVTSWKVVSALSLATARST